MSYSTEAMLWGTDKSNLVTTSPKVAGLVMDNDFGLAYEMGFEAYAENKLYVVSEYLPVRRDPAALTLTNEVTTIAALDPTFISMTAGNPCLLAIQEVEASGLLIDFLQRLRLPFAKASLFTWPCRYGGRWMGIAGGGVKDITDPQYIDEPS